MAVRSASKEWSPLFVFYTSQDARVSLEQAVPLVCTCAELVGRGHRCRFLARGAEVASIVGTFTCYASRPVVERVEGLVEAMTSSVEESFGALVEAEGATSVVGVADAYATAWSAMCRRHGVAYYATFPGPLRQLRKVLARPLFSSEPEVRATLDAAVAVFASSLETEVECFSARVPENAHLVRSFGPAPASVPLGTVLDGLDASSERGVVVVACGQLTAPGLRALYQGLALCRDKLVVLWHVADERVFERARLDDEAVPPSADWFLPVRDSRPRLSVLASARVLCLVASCDWADATDALCCGVPVLALPLTPDQRAVANYLARDLGVASLLDSVDPDCREKALPTPPDKRQPERFTPADVAATLLALSAPDSKFHINSLSLQVNFYSNKDDFGSSLVATIIENDIDDGTLAHAQADALRHPFDPDQDAIIHTTTLTSAKATFFGCSDDFICAR